MKSIFTLPDLVRQVYMYEKVFGRRSWNHSNLYPNKSGIKKRPRAYMTDYYTDQDKFLSMMIEAYENKEIPCWYVL